MNRFTIALLRLALYGLSTVVAGVLFVYLALWRSDPAMGIVWGAAVWCAGSLFKPDADTMWAIRAILHDKD